MQEIPFKNYSHLGDAVWELFVREQTVCRASNLKQLHELTTSMVNAKYQSELLQHITKYLTEEELEVVRRGRNQHVPVARRQNQAEYRQATAFEVLIGWLYTNNKGRLLEIYEIINKNLEEK